MKTRLIKPITNSQQLITALFVTFVVSYPTFAVESSGGTGEPNAPYQIATAEQLISIGSDTDLLSKHFVLISDIDLNPCLPGGRVFDRAVIGSDANYADIEDIGLFSGSFDGQGHAISNLTIDVSTQISAENSIECSWYYIGLFGEVASEASIISLKIADANMIGDSVCSNGMGIMAGRNMGDIVSCFISGTISGGSIGGLVGSNTGTIEQCVFMGTVNPSVA